MSTIDFVVEHAASKTGGDPKAVRSLIGRGIRHIPEGSPINKASMASALKVTRTELADPEEIRIVEHIEAEFRSMGFLKQTLVFGMMNSKIDEIRAELKS